MKVKVNTALKDPLSIGTATAKTLTITCWTAVRDGHFYVTVTFVIKDTLPGGEIRKVMSPDPYCLALERPTEGDQVQGQSGLCILGQHELYSQTLSSKQNDGRNGFYEIKCSIHFVL